LPGIDYTTLKDCGLYQTDLDDSGTIRRNRHRSNKSGLCCRQLDAATFNRNRKASIAICQDRKAGRAYRTNSYMSVLQRQTCLIGYNTTLNRPTQAMFWRARRLRERDCETR